MNSNTSFCRQVSDSPTVNYGSLCLRAPHAALIPATPTLTMTSNFPSVPAPSQAHASKAAMDSYPEAQGAATALALWTGSFGINAN